MAAEDTGLPQTRCRVSFGVVYLEIILIHAVLMAAMLSARSQAATKAHLLHLRQLTGAAVTALRGRRARLNE